MPRATIPRKSHEDLTSALSPFGGSLQDSISCVLFPSISLSMKSYQVILEHWQTHKIMFLKVEDCKDMDECIDHVKKDYPDHNIERISPIK